jgi:hypothetical protein
MSSWHFTHRVSAKELTDANTFSVFDLLENFYNHTVLNKIPLKKKPKKKKNKKMGMQATDW